MEPAEEKETPELQTHCQQQLEQLGMTFGQGAFQLLNVCRQDRHGFQFDTSIGTLVSRGGTDAVTVPYGELSWKLQFYVVIEWQLGFEDPPSNSLHMCTISCAYI